MEDDSPRPGPHTVTDYLAVPEGTRCQLIDGFLVMEPAAPSRFHQDVVGNLYVLLRPYVEAKKLGRVYLAPFDVYLSDRDVLQPDLCFYSRKRIARLNDAGAKGSPDLAIEVVSPSTARLERGRKRAIYRRDGVREFWLIEPADFEVHVFEFKHDPEQPVRTVRLGESFESPLLPGLKIDADEVFRA